MTVDALKDCNKRDLAQLAKEQGITGWHAMRKDQLIRALSLPRPSAASGRGKAAPKANGQPHPKGRAGARPRRMVVPPPRLPRSMRRPPARTPGSRLPEGSDRRPDPRFVLAPCVLGAQSDHLGPGPGGTRPGLAYGTTDPASHGRFQRGYDLLDRASGRDIPIHGGVNNWYIDVVEPPRSYRIDIGYLSRRGRFYVLARSNVVTTPKAGITDPLDQNWIDVQKQFDRIETPATIGGNTNGNHHANTAIDLRDLFEERLRRPMCNLAMQNLTAASLAPLGRDFHFQIDAELIVYGTTEPNARVTLQGEPVQLRADGTFTVRFSLPDSRQIIPAVAASADGIEERTIVLAVERNTKELEPMIHDNSEI